VLGLGAWFIVSNPAGRNSSASDSISGRLVMARVGIRMFEEAPVFGIGIAEFYGKSVDFAGGSLASIGLRAGENAHNNFIQVLAEQGVVGLCALLWWLAAILLGGGRALISNPRGARGALLVAIVACIGTWLTGHPLLVPEFTFVFWLYCGILAAMTPAVRPSRTSWLLWALVAGVLVSVPLRASALRDAVNLEYQGFGLSLWGHDDTQRYREVGESFALYLPADSEPIELPVRLAPGAPNPLVVDVRIRDQPAATIVVRGIEWQTAAIAVPQRSRRFELVEFSVRPAESALGLPRVLLRVGKPVSR
jgi:hypothetical protein